MSLRDILLGISIAILWGANFVASKYGMTQFAPFQFTALRFATVALILLPFVKIPRGNMKNILLLATVLGAGHFGFMIAGMWYGLDIATTVITAQLGVPIACILSAVFLKDRLGMWRISGLIIAFVGIFVVVGTPKVAENLTGFFMVLFGAVGFGGSTIVMKRIRNVNIFSMLAWMSLFSVPQILVLSFIMEDNFLAHLEAITLLPAAGILYSAIGSTIIAYGLWYYLMNKYEVSQVSPFSLLSPVFGIISGQLFFGEALSMQTLIGGIVVILGVSIIVFRRPKLAVLGER